MGLSEVIDIRETQQPNNRGELERAFVVEFLTDETSGPKTVTIPEDEFSPEVARQRAAEKAQEIDDVFTSGDDSNGS